ncbi:MAG: DUF1553 domain-containing protein [Bryobacterales bacterium]|nr:DUF1553 domain-containing protein [Bryobacterales bacterium]
MRCRVPAAAVLAALASVSTLPADAVKREFTRAERRWWAIQPVAQPDVPKIAGNPIDALILAKLQEKGLRPSPPADRITWLRRVTLDVTGLMPTPDEVQAFLADDSPAAHERVVDRLLASPRYGERWARHWLDLARYADSEGFKADETRPNVWRYRDYVIDSFNQDNPYDRFVQEQIAGDELFPGDPQALIATGFSRHFPDESNARNIMQRRQELLDDVTDTVGSAFLGLTVGCARCHDHKFDPILHRDYYRLQAFFANTRIEDEADLTAAGDRADYERQHKVWDEKTRGIREEMAVLARPMQAKLFQDGMEKFPEAIQDAILTPAAQRTPFQWQMYYKARPQVEHSVESAGAKLRGEDGKRWTQLQAKLAEFDSIKPEPPAVAQAMIDNGVQAPKTHVLNGGAWDAPLYEVQPGFLTILDPSDALVAPQGNSSGRRAALARWLTDPANPLTARVIVNRVWHYHFGQGIVATPSDFGRMGERPSNPELLDYLARVFVADGWSLKKLHRRILLSTTYRQSSRYEEAAARVDPRNTLLWRFSPRRLEGEAIRDSMLQVAGRLNTKMHGPGVFPPLPVGVMTRGGWSRELDASEAERRSIYIFVRRNTRYPMLEAFDMPDTHESCARRNTTLTAPQALELMNNHLVLDWARSFAGRILNDGGVGVEAQIDRAWKLAFSRTPSEAERAGAIRFLERHRPIMEERLRESVVRPHESGAGKQRPAPPPLPANLPAGVDPARAAALVDFCHMLFNSNEFVYLN